MARARHAWKYFLCAPGLVETTEVEFTFNVPVCSVCRAGEPGETAPCGRDKGEDGSQRTPPGDSCTGRGRRAERRERHAG